MATLDGTTGTKKIQGDPNIRTGAWFLAYHVFDGSKFRFKVFPDLLCTCTRDSFMARLLKRPLSINYKPGFYKTHTFSEAPAQASQKQFHNSIGRPAERGLALINNTGYNNIIKLNSLKYTANIRQNQRKRATSMWRRKLMPSNTKPGRTRSLTSLLPRTPFPRAGCPLVVLPYSRSSKESSTIWGCLRRSRCSTSGPQEYAQVWNQGSA